MRKRIHFFTLIEILTVMAILAVLAGIVVGGVVIVNGKNAETQTLATIKALEMALNKYKMETGSIYTGVDGAWNAASIRPIRLTVPGTIPGNLNGTLWKYLDQKLINSATKVDGTNRYFVDAWGNALLYRIPGKFNSSGFDLGSVGPDGKLGDGVGTAFGGGTALPSDVTANYNAAFGLGDDITNFVRQ
ncbi:MAG: type II secretion system protein GspG [Lentisphaeria bacterium]|nr:type II secretion system protein GspG [Lentisphaeria bacterium]